MQSELLPKLIRITTVPQSLRGLLKGQLRFMSDYFEVIGISSSGEDIGYVEREEGIRVIPIEMTRKITLIQDLRALWQLYNVFRKERPLIVHSITPKAGLLSMIAAKMSGVSIRMHTFTGLIFPTQRGAFQKLLIWMDRLLCACATNVYPEGNGVKSDLIRYRITSKSLKVLANGNVNGIDTSFFNPLLFSLRQKHELRQKLKIQTDDFIFIFVGRLVRDKGINELVEVFDGIGRKYGHAKLLLVGKEESDLDPLKKETLRRIATNNNIISVGYQQDVRLYFAASDALVFPSHREGFPNVVMQAGAMGLPSIVTDINGCNEIIIESENGTIIPAKDTRALKEKMELFITDRALIEKLRSNAREMIVSRYEQKMVWEALLEEYKNLLGKY
jgi:glycosyltransferase involved in cell wall biosynthesis